MNTAQRILQLATDQLGYREGQDQDGAWNNIEKYAGQVPGLEWAQGQPWCAVFTSWLALHAGVPTLYPCTASCDSAVKWFKGESRFSEYPAIGAQVFFGAGGGEHTGIVEAYDATTITTIEGNANDGHAPAGVGDAVIRTIHQRRDTYVYGYGYPKFPEGITSADPQYASQGPVQALQPFPGTEWFKAEPAHSSPIVTAMGRRLVQEGCSEYHVGPGPQWTEADRLSYQQWQLKLGYKGTAPGQDADGYPGEASWNKLQVPLQ